MDYTVRCITVDGEFVSETPAMSIEEAHATFEDTVDQSGAGIFVQLINDDFYIVAEELIEEEA